MGWTSDLFLGNAKQYSQYLVENYLIDNGFNININKIVGANFFKGNVLALYLETKVLPKNKSYEDCLNENIDIQQLETAKDIILIKIKKFGFDEWGYKDVSVFAGVDNIIVPIPKKIQQWFTQDNYYFKNYNVNQSINKFKSPLNSNKTNVVSFESNIEDKAIFWLAQVEFFAEQEKQLNKIKLALKNVDFRLPKFKHNKAIIGQITLFSREDSISTTENKLALALYLKKSKYFGSTIYCLTLNEDKLSEYNITLKELSNMDFDTAKKYIESEKYIKTNIKHFSKI